TLLQDEMIVAPCFSSFTLAIEHGSARPSFVDLPTRPAVMPMLACFDPSSVSLVSPQNVRYRLEAPASLAGLNWATLWTTSGTATVIPLGSSDPARFTPDGLTPLLATNNSPLADWFGVLPPSGLGFPLLKLSALGPLPASLFGLRVSALGLVMT